MKYNKILTNNPFWILTNAENCLVIGGKFSLNTERELQDKSALALKRILKNNFPDLFAWLKSVGMDYQLEIHVWKNHIDSEVVRELLVIKTSESNLSQIKLTWNTEERIIDLIWVDSSTIA